MAKLKMVKSNELVPGELYSDMSVLSLSTCLLEFVRKSGDSIKFRQHTGPADYFKDKEGLISFSSVAYFYKLD